MPKIDIIETDSPADSLELFNDNEISFYSVTQ